jgi:hypothetical protein
MTGGSPYSRARRSISATFSSRAAVCDQLPWPRRAKIAPSSTGTSSTSSPRTAGARATAR